MPKNLRTSHLQIARQIRALERSVVAFQSGFVRASDGPGGVDTNTAILLSARLSTVWKRIGEMIPRAGS
jgi:hypothetical protein